MTFESFTIKTEELPKEVTCMNIESKNDKNVSLTIQCSIDDLEKNEKTNKNIISFLNDKKEKEKENQTIYKNEREYTNDNPKKYDSNSNDDIKKHDQKNKDGIIRESETGYFEPKIGKVIKRYQDLDASDRNKLLGEIHLSNLIVSGDTIKINNKEGYRVDGYNSGRNGYNFTTFFPIGEFINKVDTYNGIKDKQLSLIYRENDDPSENDIVKVNLPSPENVKILTPDEIKFVKNYNESKTTEEASKLIKNNLSFYNELKNALPLIHESGKDYKFNENGDPKEVPKKEKEAKETKKGFFQSGLNIIKKTFTKRKKGGKKIKNNNKTKRRRFRKSKKKH